MHPEKRWELEVHLRWWRLAVVAVHYKRRVRSHVQRSWNADWGIDLLSRGFVGCFMFETLLPTLAQHDMIAFWSRWLWIGKRELEGVFGCWDAYLLPVMSCQWESGESRRDRRWIGRLCCICYSYTLLRQVSLVWYTWRGKQGPVNKNTRSYLRRQEARVFSPLPPSPFPLSFNSKLISNMGSTVDVTFPHFSHFTSLCNCPAKTLCTMQLQETLVEPREVVWIWFRARMKNSWASCWAYPDRSVEARQVVWRKEVGPWGTELLEYIYKVWTSDFLNDTK